MSLFNGPVERVAVLARITAGRYWSKRPSHHPAERHHQRVMAAPATRFRRSPNTQHQHLGMPGDGRVAQ